MRRREFFGVAGGALAAGRAFAAECGCADQSIAQGPVAQAGAQAASRPASSSNATPWQTGQYDGVLSKVRITNVKVFGVTYDQSSDRPYVFVKLETDAGVVGWGEATLEGKAGAVIACVNDFRDFLI